MTKERFGREMEMFATECSERVYDASIDSSVLSFLELGKPGVALDCGCGSGGNARLLKERNWVVFGMTISPKERLMAQDVCKAVYLSDLETGIPNEAKGPFDLILFSHVLEHLRNPSRALRGAAALLADHGVIAVALPNVLFLRNRLRFLFGRFEYEENGIMDCTHLRFYTLESGKRLLEANGFRVSRAGTAGVFPCRPRFLRRLAPGLCKQLDQIAGRLLPGLFGMYLFYVAKPASEQP